MRKVKENRDWKFPKTRKTDFTKEEMLDILDFYLQYKPMLDEYVADRDHYPEFDPHDFTLLLYMYEMLDVEYIENVSIIQKKYGKQFIDDLCKEKFDFLEAITLFTWIHRTSRGDMGGNETYDYCIENDIYYHLLCRLEEIKYELES